MSFTDGSMTTLCAKNILITGAPGVGKTTLIRRLVNDLGRLRCTGFYTAEIREGGIRKGFELIGLDGCRAMLAHVDIHGPCRVGRYGVDVKGFDRFLDDIGFPQAAADVVIVDEIGKMELFSKKFIHRLDAVFFSPQRLVATISAAGPDSIQRYKYRKDVALFEVNRSNRGSLPGKIAALVLLR